MGIKVKIAVSIQHRFRSIIRGIFLEGARHHSTLDDMLDQVASKVYNEEEWKRSPAWVKAFLQGYLESKKDEVVDNAVWMMSLDGQLLTKEEIDAQTKTESESLNPTMNTRYRSPWSRVDGNKGRHVWRDIKTGQPLRDKPIDKKWINDQL
jgi:hypothetical protein